MTDRHERFRHLTASEQHLWAQVYAAAWSYWVSHGRCPDGAAVAAASEGDLAVDLLRERTKPAPSAEDSSA